MSLPTIHKAAHLSGKTLILRDAALADAELILNLRTNERNARFLSRVSGSLEAQQSWLESYARRDNEAYFIIENKQQEKLGTVRLYDAKARSFCWGSWILAEHAPSTAAIESALIVYTYAIETLGFEQAHFQVNKLNTGVQRFHERFGAVRVAEDEDQFHYELGPHAIRHSLERYRRYLPAGIAIKEKYS